MDQESPIQDFTSFVVDDRLRGERRARRIGEPFSRERQRADRRRAICVEDTQLRAVDHQHLTSRRDHDRRQVIPAAPPALDRNGRQGTHRLPAAAIQSHNTCAATDVEAAPCSIQRHRPAYREGTLDTPVTGGYHNRLADMAAVFGGDVQPFVLCIDQRRTGDDEWMLVRRACLHGDRTCE